MWDEISKRFNNAFLFEVLVKTLEALVILVVLYFLGRIARTTIARFASRTSRNTNFSALLSNLTFALFIVIALVAILTIYTGAGLSSLLTLLGVLSLAVSLSVQDVLKNFVAGVYILLEQPFKIGDRIEVKGIEGLVESIEIRTTNIRTDEGLQVIVPNGTVFTEIVTNRSAYNRRLTTIQITLNTGQTFKDASAKIDATLKGMVDPSILPDPAPTIVLENITGGKTSLRLEFWASQDAPAGLAARVAENLQRDFPEADVSIPAA